MTSSRNTPWRQGLVLPPDVAQAIGLVSDGDEACVVVVSHDCDLAQDSSIEADVEVIIGRWVLKVDGNFSHAKNARRLHLPLTGGTQSAVAELRSDGKQTIPKARLDGKHPSSAVCPKRSEREILQRWLAGRYRRAAFPHEFNQRLDALDLRETMAKVLKKNGHLISAIYFDVDRGKQVERSTPQDTYELSIYFLYHTARDPAAAEQAAAEAAESIQETFRKKCCSAAGVWTQIELIECEAVSDRAMSVQQADNLARWFADHISLRTDPPTTMRQDD